MSRAGFVSGLATAAVIAGLNVMPADASINSQVTAFPALILVLACFCKFSTLRGMFVAVCASLQMSMDSNSFSVLSDNQKVYKSTGVRRHLVSVLRIYAYTA